MNRVNLSKMAQYFAAILVVAILASTATVTGFAAQGNLQSTTVATLTPIMSMGTSAASSTPFSVGTSYPSPTPTNTPAGSTPAAQFTPSSSQTAVGASPTPIATLPFVPSPTPKYLNGNPPAPTPAASIPQTGAAAASGPKNAVIALVEQMMASEPQTGVDQPERNKSQFLQQVLDGTYRQTGDQVEKDFMSFMIVHHNVAVRMAYECMQKAVHPELRSLCEEIGKSQSIQIAQQNYYLAKFYNLYQDPSELEQDEFIINELQNLQGDAFDKRWLELMAPHHAQAVETSKVCASGASHYEVVALCQGMAFIQSAQITEMAGMLQNWYGENITTDPHALAMSVENVQEPTR